MLAIPGYEPQLAEAQIRARVPLVHKQQSQQVANSSPKLKEGGTSLRLKYKDILSDNQSQVQAPALSLVSPSVAPRNEFPRTTKVKIGQLNQNNLSEL